MSEQKRKLFDSNLDFNNLSSLVEVAESLTSAKAFIQKADVYFKRFIDSLLIEAKDVLQYFSEEDFESIVWKQILGNYRRWQGDFTKYDRSNLVKDINDKYCENVKFVYFPNDRHIRAIHKDAYDVLQYDIREHELYITLSWEQTSVYQTLGGTATQTVIDREIAYIIDIRSKQFVRFEDLRNDELHTDKIGWMELYKGPTSKYRYYKRY